MSMGKTSSRRLRAAERRTLAMQLRIKGLTYRRISDTIHGHYTAQGRHAELPKNYDHREASADVMYEVAKLNAEKRAAAEECYALTVMRLEEMIAGIYKRAIGYTAIDQETHAKEAIPAELAALDRLLRIVDRQAKLHGIDSPERSEVVHNPDEILVIGGFDLDDI